MRWIPPAIVGVVTFVAVAGTALVGLSPHTPTHAAGTHFVHFIGPGGDVWVDATKVEAVDAAQNGYTYMTRISMTGHVYFVVGTVNAAEAAINAALP
jgi:hypothetical protein